MNLEASINNVAIRLERLDTIGGPSNRTGLRVWKGKPIIPLYEWIELRDTPYMLKYLKLIWRKGLVK